MHFAASCCQTGAAILGSASFLPQSAGKNCFSTQCIQASGIDPCSVRELLVVSGRAFHRKYCWIITAGSGKIRFQMCAHPSSGIGEAHVDANFCLVLLR